MERTLRHWDFELYPKADGRDPQHDLAYIQDVMLIINEEGITVWKNNGDGTVTFVACAHPSIGSSERPPPSSTLDLGDEQSIAEVKAVLERFQTKQ